jgi:hypothetical protein
MVPELIDRSRNHFAEERFELGESVFDRIGVRGTGQKVEQSRTGGGSGHSGVTDVQARRSTYWRTLRNLPLQGRPLMVASGLRVSRCRETTCDQQTFTERLPGVIEFLLRVTYRVVDLI